MPTFLVAALLPVVAYCVVRSLAADRADDRADDRAHRRDLYLWHVALGVAMVAGVVGMGAPVAILAATVSLAGLGWGLLSLDRRVTRGAYARLAVGAAAMAVMTLPMTLPAPAQAADGDHPAMSGMADHAAWLPLVPLLLLGLAISGAGAVVVVAARTSPAVRRLDACCDLVMAGVVAVMLVGLL